MLALGVIPARYHSSRFPGKSLALIGGTSLVQRVYERAREARRLSRLLVATDDERIAGAVAAFGGEAMMTSTEHPSGTDRLAEVARRVPADIYVNVQGDEPLLDPSDVDGLVDCLQNDANVGMATLAQPMSDPLDAADPNVVKVVCDAAGRALYFSRSPIPFRRPGAEAGGGESAWLRHVGLYAYRAPFLMQFSSWRQGSLERTEGLEQLRALEAGCSIRVLRARGRYLGVDTPGDVIAVEKELMARS